MDKHSYFENKAKLFNVRMHLDLLLDHFQNDPVGKNLVLKWRKIILAIYREEGYPAPIDIRYETFSLVVRYTTGFFEYTFNIDHSNALIAQIEKEPIEMPVREAIKYVDLENAQGNIKTELNHHSNPILIVKSQLFDLPHCINGNHRILDAYKKGEKTITLYWIEELECIPLLSTKLGRAMFMMNADIISVLDAGDNFNPKTLLIEKANQLLSTTQEKDIY
jgi:hypothetical protein